MSRISNAFNVTVGSAPNTALYNAAFNLSVGSIASFGSGPSWFNAESVTWQTSTVYHDANRKLVHVVGKMHSFTNPEHYIYDEQNQTWSSDTISFGSSGHMWNTAFAPEHGEYYWTIDGTLQRYIPGSGWTSTPSSGLAYGAGPAGIGWHPHLFGQNDGGIVLNTLSAVGAWRRQTNTWRSPPLATGLTYVGYNGGSGAYDSVRNKLWVGTGNDGQVATGINGVPRALIISQGPTLSYGTYPQAVYGGGESDSCHKVIPHPYVAGRLLFIPGNYDGQCYYSDDTGSSWTLAGYRNPFTNDRHQWTCGTVYGVVYGIASRGGGWVKLWKPPS